MVKNRFSAAALLALLAMAGCDASDEVEQAAPAAPAQAWANVTAERLLAAEEEPGQWMSHGRTYSEQRFSPLDQINTNTVDRLGLAWYADFDTNRGQEATPIVVDGVIYVSTAWSKVYAYDAKTGEQLWQYDPEVPGEWAVNACCDVVNRGVAVWEGKVYLGALDGRLIAVDAATGREVWSVQTTDPEKPYTITGAPRVAKGMVLIGQGGAEFGVRGYVSAYDATSGELVWRWYTVPGNPADGFETPELEEAAKTWGGEYWKTGAGGTTWDSIVYDPVTDFVYVGVGNGSPWPHTIRSDGFGDNLFLSSIVALDIDDGSYQWHYQTVPADSWDYTATQPIMTAQLDLNGDGRTRHVVMQAPKNGFFYVLDAYTGELLSAEKIIPVTWASHIDMETGRPVENPEARYDVTNKGAIVVPSAGGAHSWHPWSYNPDTGLVYIPTMHTNFPFVVNREGDDNPMGQKLSISFNKGMAMYEETGIKRLSGGFLQAWDPVAQKEVWRVEFGDGRGGGTLSTAGGLVFQGNSAFQEFAAYRAENGEKLWSMPVDTGVVAGAVTYKLDGEQYVAIVVGAGQRGGYYSSNHSRLLAFKLDATLELPEPTPPVVLTLDPPADDAPREVVAHGADLYDQYCSLCHGTDGLSRGLFPDLRYSSALHAQEDFDAIVLDGIRSDKGMVSFAEALDGDDSAALRAYVIAIANEPQEEAPNLGPPPAGNARDDEETGLHGD